MSGALASIAITLDGDLGIGRDVVVTATATATDSDGRQAADAYKITFTYWSDFNLRGHTSTDAKALGKDGAASTLVIAVGPARQLHHPRNKRYKVVGVLAEVVEATAAAPAH